MPKLYENYYIKQMTCKFKYIHVFEFDLNSTDKWTTAA